MNITTIQNCGLGPFFFNPPRPFDPKGITIVIIDSNTGNPVTRHHNLRWEAIPITITSEGPNPDETFDSLERQRQRMLQRLHIEAKRILGPDPRIIEYLILAQVMSSEKPSFWGLGKPRRYWYGELQTVMFAVACDEEFEV